mmetsp:Transcript_2164/g.4686  ORF Transcript_2164/g.4686 Transcript_2164/m.4686 type:complete len:682 (+) Transcript_2164:147-2192(+)
MKFSVASISLWNIAFLGRPDFAAGLISTARRSSIRASGGRFSSTAGFMSKSSNHMPHNYPRKRAREEGSDRYLRAFKSKSNCLKMEASSSTGLENRSLYERKLGKIITACPKCHGDGKIRANLSKKSRARRKQKLQQSIEGIDKEEKVESNNNFIPSPTKPCPECSGSGLVAANPNSKETILNENQAKNQPSFRPKISVAIVGGGIGGIALAAALQQRNIPCVVYERDLSFEERNQGYGLTMQQGARALRSLGFFGLSDNTKEKCSEYSKKGDNNQKHDKFGIHSSRHVVHKPDGRIVGEWGMKVWGGRFEKNGRGHATRQNAHISRQNLRKLLMEMLKPDTIKWGYKFMGYSERLGVSNSTNENCYLNIKFKRRSDRSSPGPNESESEDHEIVSENATVLVGCDGIRSAVRQSKLGEDAAPLRYLGCIVILGIAESPDSEITDGKTVFQTADGTTRLYAMPFARPGEESDLVAQYLRGGSSSSLSELNEKGLSMWQLSFPMGEQDARELSGRGPTALKAEVLRRCHTWHTPIPELLSKTPEGMITGYPCYDRSLVNTHTLRVGNSGQSETGGDLVTLLGDAAHPMSPFKGQGANQALLDAVFLAQKLHASIRVDRNPSKDGKFSIRDEFPLVLAEFEEEMITRAAVKVKKSADAAKFLHTDVAISEGNVTRGAAASVTTS